MSKIELPDAEQGARVAVDFSALLEGVRTLKPKCAECGVALQESVTGVRSRISDDGIAQKICRACAVSEIGENLVRDLPR